MSPTRSGQIWLVLGLGARIAVGIVFVVAGLSKVRFRGFQRTVAAAGIPERYAGWIAHMLPQVEIASGSLLLLGIGVPAAYSIVLALTVVFTLVLVVNLIRGATFECGCFGSLSAPIGWSTVARNLVLAGLALVGLLSKPTFALWDLSRGSASAPSLQTADALAIVIVSSLLTVGGFIVSAAWRTRSAVASYGTSVRV